MRRPYVICNKLPSVRKVESLEVIDRFLLTIKDATVRLQNARRTNSIRSRIGAISVGKIKIVLGLQSPRPRANGFGVGPLCAWQAH